MVEPHQRDHEGEHPVPLEVLRRPSFGRLLDEVEVQDQVQGRDHDHDEAEADTDGAGRVDVGHRKSKQAPDDRDEIHEADAAGRRHDPELEVPVALMSPDW